MSVFTFALALTIAAASPSAPTPKGARAMTVNEAERALRAEANQLVAARRAAMLKKDRRAARCYNDALVRLDKDLSEAHETVRRVRGLRLVRGTPAPDDVVEQGAAQELSATVAAVRHERRRALRCVRGEPEPLRSKRPAPTMKRTVRAPPTRR